MDPKKALEAFRVDKIPKKTPIQQEQYHQKSKPNNVILIILFATVLGLTTGIGSAFAFGVSEVQPRRLPLDEPSAKAQAEVSVPEVKHSTTELSPLTPPIDQPVEEEKSPPMEQPKNDPSPTVKEHTPSNKPKEDKVEKRAKKDNATHEDKPVHKQQVEKEEKSTSLPNPSTSVHQDSSTPSIGNSKTHYHSQKHPDPSSDFTNSTTTHGKDQLMASSHNDEDNVSKHIETPDPKTKQGILPHTAGNDLNHAVASLVLVCFSIAYLLARRENHPV